MEEKNLPFISVIVPFYNIEECVEYCLDSLVNQDYEGEYEILCINDGSTDGTAATLDAYAEGHHRVRVLHKPNGGISDARNFGVAHAKGEYISFVDGDDLVSPYYLSALTGGLQIEKNVVVIGVQRNVNFADVGSVSWDMPGIPLSMSTGSLLQKVCFQQLFASAWGKLASKDIYADNPFPVARVYEDTYIFANHVDAADGFVLVDGAVYGYVVRDGSIVRPKKEKLRRCIQQLEAMDRFCGYVNAYFPEDSDEQVVFKALEYSRLWRRLDLVDDFPSDVEALQQMIRNYIKAHLKQLRGCPDVVGGNKVRFVLLALSPTVYRCVFSVYDKAVKGLR